MTLLQLSERLNSIVADMKRTPAFRNRIDLPFAVEIKTGKRHTAKAWVTLDAVDSAHFSVGNRHYLNARAHAVTTRDEIQTEANLQGNRPNPFPLGEIPKGAKVGMCQACETEGVILDVYSFRGADSLVCEVCAETLTRADSLRLAILANRSEG